MSLCFSDNGKLYGVYRGKVVKHLPHGRCKIYIPAAYSEEFADKPDMLPSAEQAVPLFAGSNKGNGVFSYPNIGAIVLCMFYNGDANFPVYFAATLGGENAFGQYSIIKKDLKEENGKEINSTEEVSERHLVTSGKTHIEWYENGKLSAIVEDPIRTICSVDYDSWEKGNDNISADDKYQSTLSNDNVRKIRDNELSNIDCQLVLDNNGKTHGKLSTSTHYFDLLNSKDKDTGTQTNGRLSIDNWNIMSNDGKIKIGTLSTCDYKVKSDSESSQEKVEVHNIYELLVPGMSNSSVKNKSKVKKESSEQKITSDIELTGYSNFCFDYNNNYTLTGYHSALSNVIDDQLTSNIKDKLSNNLTFEDNGAFCLSSNILQNRLVTGQVKDPQSEKEDDYIAVSINDTHKLSSILSTHNGDSAFETIELSTSLNGSNNINTSISNQILMDKLAKITLNASIDAKYAGDKNQTLDNKSNAILDGNLGSYHRTASWKNNDGDTNSQITNVYNIDINNNFDSSISESLASDKREDGGKVVDFNFTKNIDAQTSTFDILVNDKISKNQFIRTINCMNGTVDVSIVSNQTGNKCIISFDSQGKMTVFTTDKLDIQTKNSVTITTPQTTINGATTINGPTTVNNTLHVTSQTTIDSDAKIAGISFIGHMHVGNMGAPTSPPL